MGTSTIYRRYNDFGLRFKDMTKGDLKELEKLSPFSKEKNSYRGWTSEFELHNGNIYPIIFCKGRLFQLDDAPKILNNKYYSSLYGKKLKEYEWTILKKYLLNQIEYLDKIFKKEIGGNKKK